VRFIRLQWLDYTNMLRCRIITREFTRQLDLCHPVGAELLTLLQDENGDVLHDLAGAVGESPLIPDWNSLRLCPWAPEHASVQCFFGKYNSGPEQQDQEHLSIDEMCPRSALRRAIVRAKKLGLRMNIRFEIEFCVSGRNEDGSPLGRPQVPHSASSINTLENFMLPIMDEIVTCLEDAGVSVLEYHTGDHKGQYKITTEDREPLIAADTLIFTRQAIRNVCKKHSLAVTFYPSWPPNGVHINLSLLDSGPEESFLAGMLEHLRAVFAFGLPLPESYSRVLASRRRFGRSEAWGSNNREVPIRRTSQTSWQLRFMDASANIYLVLAAIIISGTAGVKEKMTLTVKDCRVDPETLSAEDRMGLGISHRLPSKLKKAQLYLTKDRVLNNALGSGLVTNYLRVTTRFALILNR
ncbi:glutamine synthetase/guanido kinase, partial [Hypoxylon sp. EC38]